MSEKKLLEGLNLEQKAAVTHGEGPLLIVAGAGTGKTGVITRRIAWLIQTGRAKPGEILALTFSEKAAAEMQDRVYDLVPLGQAPSHISTFHGFSNRILQNHSFELGIPPTFRVLDQQQQILLLREHLFELPLSKLRPRSNPTGHLKQLAVAFSRAKEEDVSADEYARHVKKLEARCTKETDQALRAELEHDLTYQREIAGAFAFYEAKKDERYLIDFSDQVFRAHRLLKEAPVVLERLRRQFRYILVDEFQDTNIVQYRLVRLLAGEAANLTVVGDDDQSIYAFRGADLHNLLGFEEDYPGSARVVLTQNYRSTQPILDAAYRLIGHNNPERLEVKDGIDKRLKSEAEGGAEPRFISAATPREEADAVAEFLAERHREGVAYRELAILIPRRSLTSELVRSLSARKMPAVYEEATGLYDRPEVAMCISLLRLTVNRTRDRDVVRLLRGEVYPLPQEDFDRLAREQLRTNEDWWSLISRVDSSEYSAAAVTTVKHLVADVEELGARAPEASVGELLFHWFGGQRRYLAQLREGSVADAELKGQNLSRFFRRLDQFAETAEDPSASAWLRYFDDTRELLDERSESELDDFDQDAVRILTIHQSKGLEFDTVVVAGCSADHFGSLPGGEQINCRFLYVHPMDEAGEERERRRLFYVAVTRAKRVLAFSAASYYNRRGKARLAPFVEEALGSEAVAGRVVPDFNPLKVVEQAVRPAPLEVSHVWPEPLTLTVTQLDAYLTCPRKFFWKYVVRAYEEPTHHRAYGDLIHRLIAEISQARAEERELPLEKVLEHYDQAWKNEYYLSRDHERDSYELGRETLKRFYAAEQERTPAEAIERDFTFKVGGAIIRGTYDRIEREGEETVLVDYKTTAVTSQASADERAKKSPQLKLYAMALRATEGKLPARVALHFIESGVVGVATHSERVLANMEQKIGEAVAAIRRQEYPVTEPDHYCADTPLNDCPGHRGNSLYEE